MQNRSIPPEVLRIGVLKIRRKFTGKHPCRSVISAKLKLYLNHPSAWVYFCKFAAYLIHISWIDSGSCDYSDRTCLLHIWFMFRESIVIHVIIVIGCVLRIVKNYSSQLKLSYSYFLSFIFISLVRASSGDSVILFISDKDSFIDWIISREIR